MWRIYWDRGFSTTDTTFRWVCLSESPKIWSTIGCNECIDPIAGPGSQQFNWIRDAEKNRLVSRQPGTLLYQDAIGRRNIALRFNKLVRDGECGPIMLGRDHHDTGGTDSPFRETSNIKDGSNIMADMATHVFAGNCARGMSLVALHNGGGAGIGKAINGGFGMVLDGSERVDEILRSAMPWDVMGGVARRSWARNENAVEVCMEYNRMGDANHITLPFIENEDKLRDYVHQQYSARKRSD